MPCHSVRLTNIPISPQNKRVRTAAQAAKDADLDYNGDGKVDVKDLVDADADFQNTGDGFTFYKFLDAYLEYLSK